MTMRHNQAFSIQGLGVLALAVALAAAGCTSEDGGTSGSGGAGGTGGAGGMNGGATGEPTFDAIYNEILIRGAVGNCTFGACHGQPPSENSGNLQLFADNKDMTYAALVGPNSTSAACGGMPMVTPGQPDMSLLYTKLTATPPCGVRMPFGGMLTDAQIMQIRTWIANGAMNDGGVMMPTAGTNAGGAGGAGGEAGGGAGGMGGGEFTLTSSAFTDGGMLPAMHRCVALAGATGPSPALMWSNAPEGTLSFALTMTDKATTGISVDYAHWTIWDIPASTTMLPQGVMAGAMPSEPAGAKQSANQNAFLPGPGYFGPCGQMNPYEFRLYALSVATLPGVTTSSTAAEVRAAIEANAISSVAIRAISGP